TQKPTTRQLEKAPRPRGRDAGDNRWARSVGLGVRSVGHGRLDGELPRSGLFENLAERLDIKVDCCPVAGLAEVNLDFHLPLTSSRWQAAYARRPQDLDEVYCAGYPHPLCSLRLLPRLASRYLWITHARKANDDAWLDKPAVWRYAGTVLNC